MNEREQLTKQDKLIWEAHALSKRLLDTFMPIGGPAVLNWQEPTEREMRVARLIDRAERRYKRRVDAFFKGRS